MVRHNTVKRKYIQAHTNAHTYDDDDDDDSRDTFTLLADNEFPFIVRKHFKLVNVFRNSKYFLNFVLLPPALFRNHAVMQKGQKFITPNISIYFIWEVLHEEMCSQTHFNLALILGVHFLVVKSV